MSIHLLDDSLQVDVFYDTEDSDLEDNICLTIIERCPPQERIMRSGETYIYLTPQQAEAFAALLHNAAKQSQDAHKDIHH